MVIDADLGAKHGIGSGIVIKLVLTIEFEIGLTCGNVNPQAIQTSPKIPLLFNQL